jgi:branched-subunit amino acid ABC-type transport system permease component
MADGGGTPTRLKAGIISALLPARPSTRMNEHDYQLVLALYGAAALGCLLVGWRITRWMWRWLREPLRVLMAVLLLAPTLVDPAKEQFAPSVAITALDLLFQVGNNAWRAVADLSMYALLAFAAYLLFALIRWPFLNMAKKRQQQRAAAANQDDEPTLREILQQPAPQHRPGAYVDSSLDPHSDGRGRIEPRF